MGSFGSLTALLCIAIWLCVRDDPAERGYASHFHWPATLTRTPRSLSGSLMQVLSYRNIWILMLVPIGFSGAVLTFAGLWGVPCLRPGAWPGPEEPRRLITSTLLRRPGRWAGRCWATGRSAWAAQAALPDQRRARRRSAGRP